ncbi:MAG: HAAS signaling domain-containing protein, partial [Acidimicrobiales bacterium]
TASDPGRLVADFRRRLKEAARALPAVQREPLLEQIDAHLAEALPEGADELEVRRALDDLGPPELIAAAAEVAPSDRLAVPWLEVLALVFLYVGGFLVPIGGWLVGVILLAVSRRWRLSDKLLGALVWPGGLGGLFILGLVWGTTSSTSCTSGTAGGATICRSTGFVAPEWLVISGLAVLILGPLAVATRLILRLREAP